MTIKKIISGAQTGADRASLDAALALDFPIGGWVPKGRKAEDGVIPDRYTGLEEIESESYEARTRMNVLHSDATLILSHGPLHGGSKFTEVVATKHEKPVLHVDLGVTSIPDAVIAIRAWLSGLEGEVLSVAGPRASSDAEIYEKTKEIVTRLIRGEGQYL